MRDIRFLSFLIAVLAITHAQAKSAVEKARLFCPGVLLTREIDPGFRDTEKTLLCGDPKTPAWNQIPPRQREYSLRNFLEDRGYLHPQFRLFPDKNTLWVDPGEPTHVTEVDAEGAPAALHLSEKREIKGEALTPQLLTTLETWVTRKLQSQGYACPRVKAMGDPDTGKVHVVVDSGLLYTLDLIHEEDIPGLDPGTIRRDDAFRLGGQYDADLLSLSEERAAAEQIVESTHFITLCSGGQLSVTQESIPGRPKLITVGAGIDTEGIIRGKVAWRNSRMWKHSSNINITASASKLNQSLQSTLNWYFLPYPSRILMKPSAEIVHDNEQFYETLSEIVQDTVGRVWDDNSLQYGAYLGPVLNQEHTFRGVGPPNSRLLSLELSGSFKSHDFEYFAKDPRQGWDATVALDANSRDVGSSISAQRVSVQGESLWNLNNYEPALLIFGVRTGYVTVMTSEVPGVSSLIPQTDLEYLGGSTDLRGFGRQEISINGNGVGGLTSGFASFEARVNTVLPWGLEPFAFFDLGALGLAAGGFHLPLYYDPGFGIRLASPIGNFRATLAHGYEAGGPGPHHWQFYFSYGEEF